MDTRQPDDKYFTAYLAGEPTDDQFQQMGDWDQTADVTISFGSQGGQWVAIIDPNDDDMPVKRLVNEAVAGLTAAGLRPLRLEPADLEAFLDEPL